MMKSKIYLKIGAYCMLVFFLMVPEAYPDEMQVLATGIPIAISQRHEWHPWVAYNSVDDEFMVLWNTSGSLDGSDSGTTAISYHSLDAQRVSTDGDLIGDKIEISPPEGLITENPYDPVRNITWKSMPKLAYNKFRNEYMIAYMVGYLAYNPYRDQYPNLRYAPYITIPPMVYPGMFLAYGNVIERVRINNFGEVQGDGSVALWPTEWNASHTAITFNSEQREYLIVYNDKYIFTEDNPNIYDQPGFILDEVGNIISGPILVDYGTGSHFSPYLEYNPIDDTYITNFEDFRHVPPDQSWMYGPYDIYGSLLDGDGDILDGNVVNVDDTGQPDEGTNQTVPSIAHNSKDNEFLVAWTDSRPSLDGGGVIGRIINADGTPKGPDFVIADAPNTQSTPKMVYVKKQNKYFVVFADSRYDTSPPGTPYYLRESDIFAKWLKPDGTPSGEDIPIYIAPGSQTLPMLAYSPVKKRILIAWRDGNAPGDFEPAGPGAPMASEVKADVRGAIYGSP